MIIPYLFWDYNNEQHSYVMAVLKQREKLSGEGFFPAEYEGGLNMMKPEDVKNSIPVDSVEMLGRYEKANAPESIPAE